jgi:4-carboxymuconolactone decarboxylase
MQYFDQQCSSYLILPFFFTGDDVMTKEISGAQKLYGDIAPRMAEFSDEVLYKQVWGNDTLSPRDRSMITCAALIALGRVEQMHVHFGKAFENGVTQEELAEVITHLAFYSGWPTSVSAAARLKELVAEKK